MAESATKKRKFEEGESSMTVDQVASLIAVWDQDQLRRVLAKIGSMSQVAIEEIKVENGNDPKMKKIFVRNLPFTTTDASLRAMFEQFGPVTEAVVILDKVKNQSKGFGFVTYDTVEGAEACLVEPTKEIDGRQVFVNLAAKKDASSTPAVGGVGTAPAHGEDVTLRKLFVRSLSYDTTSEQLHEFFSTFGEVAEAVVLTNRETGASKGYGFVTMALSAGATAAMQEPTKQLAGRTVYVKLAASNDGRTNNAQAAPTPAYNAYNPMGNYMMNPMMMGMPPMAGQAGSYGQQAQQYAQPYQQQQQPNANAYGQQQGQQGQYWG